MRKSWMLAAAVTAAWTVTGAAAGEPHVVVTLRSIDETRDLVRTVLTSVAPEPYLQQFDALWTNLLGDPAKPGLDPRKPLGLFVTLAEKATDRPTVVGLAAVADRDALMDLLRRNNIAVGEESNGVLPIQPAGGKQGFLRFVGGHVYYGEREGDLTGALPDPAELAAIAKSRWHRVVVRFDKFPAEWRKIAREKFAAEAAKPLELGKSQAERALMEMFRPLYVEGVTALINDARELSIDTDLDAAERSLTMAVSFAAVPQSPTAKWIAGLAPAPGLLGPPPEDAAWYANVRLPMPERVREAVPQLYAQMILTGLEKQSDEGVRTRLGRLAKEAMAAVGSGATESAAMLRSLGGGRMVAVGAGRIDDGRKLLEIAREAAKDLPADKGVIRFDVAEHKGTGLHQVRITARPEGTEGGDKFPREGHFAVRGKEVLFAFGDDSAGVLRKLIDDCDTPKPAAPPWFLQYSLTGLMKLGDRDQNTWNKIAAEVFAGPDAGRDKVRVIVTGGAAMELKFEIHLALIKAGVKLFQSGLEIPAPR